MRGGGGELDISSDIQKKELAPEPEEQKRTRPARALFFRCTTPLFLDVLLF